VLGIELKNRSKNRESRVEKIQFYFLILFEFFWVFCEWKKNYFWFNFQSKKSEKKKLKICIKNLIRDIKKEQQNWIISVSITKVSVWCSLFLCKSDQQERAMCAYLQKKMLKCMRKIIHLPVPWFQQLKIIFHKFFMTVNFSFAVPHFSRDSDDLLFSSFYIFLLNFLCFESTA